MKRLVLAVLLILPLAASCDDGAGVRRNLAECKLSPEAHTALGGWDDNYLSICMQAKGYRLDVNLGLSQETKCSDVNYPGIDERCYRPDNIIANWYAAQKR